MEVVFKECTHCWVSYDSYAVTLHNSLMIPGLEHPRSAATIKLKALQSTGSFLQRTCEGTRDSLTAQWTATLEPVKLRHTPVISQKYPMILFWTPLCSLSISSHLSAITDLNQYLVEITVFKNIKPLVLHVKSKHMQFLRLFKVCL